MIEITQGDILRADAEALVNTVNCVGVMGRGIALQFKKEFPENFAAYKGASDRGDVRPGHMLIVELRQLQGPRFIVNFPTKRHWKGKSHLEDIESGLTSLVNEVIARGIKSIAVPPLGCGLGGLDWQVVRPIIEQALSELPEVRVLLYEPIGAPAAATMARTKNAPEMTIGRAALLGLMRRYLAAVMDPCLSLLEIHKLMYFMQTAGEPLRLKYTKGHYGPYAENLRHVLTLMEGHFISGYGDAADDPVREVELIAQASEKAEVFLQEHPETRRRFEQVTKLIEGFETPYGMELLATVLWVQTQEHAVNAIDAVAKVHAWNDRKKRFPKEHVEAAWNVLAKQAWLAPA